MLCICLSVVLYTSMSALFLAPCTLQGSNTGEVEHYMMMAKEIIEQLKSCAVDLRKLGQPNDDVVRT